MIEGIHISNAPGKPVTYFGSGFFPWPEPVTVEAEDTLSVSIQSRLVGERYVWRWDSRITSGDVIEKVKADFRQSTFYATPLDLKQMHRVADNYIPTLNEDGLADLFILDLMSRGMPLSDIAHRVKARFTPRFTDEQAAFDRVAELSDEYSV